MTLPGVLFLLIFAYLPMISLIIAFQDFKILMGYFASPFVGLKHFTWALTDPEFYPAFRNTVLLSLYGLVLGFPVPIMLALLINEIPRTGFKRVVQTTSYLPHFISYVVTAYLFILLLDRRGIVNDVLVAVGLVDEPVLFWTKPEYWRLLATMVNVWKGMGWSAILYLAAIAGIDEQLYEAAIIDGAGRLRRAWRITLPNMTGHHLCAADSEHGRAGARRPGHVVPARQPLHPRDLVRAGVLHPGNGPGARALLVRHLGRTHAVAAGV